MKKIQIRSIVVISVIAILFCSGCTDSSDSSKNSLQSSVTKSTFTPTPTPVPSPEKVFESYFYGYKFLNEDAIWEVLSTNAQSINSKNMIYNQIYALYSQGTAPSSYEITNLEIGDNDATMYISVDVFIQGYKFTHDKEISFVRENGEWKIDEFILLL